MAGRPRRPPHTEAPPPRRPHQEPAPRLNNAAPAPVRHATGGTVPASRCRPPGAARAPGPCRWPNPTLTGRSHSPAPLPNAPRARSGRASPRRPANSSAPSSARPSHWPLRRLPPRAGIGGGGASGERRQQANPRRTAAARVSPRARPPQPFSPQPPPGGPAVAMAAPVPPGPSAGTGDPHSARPDRP